MYSHVEDTLSICSIDCFCRQNVRRIDFQTRYQELFEKVFMHFMETECTELSTDVFSFFNSKANLYTARSKIFRTDFFF
jgi:hypothetical protein